MSAADPETLAWMLWLYDRCEADDGHIVIVNPDKRSTLGIFPRDRLMEAATAASCKFDLYLKINLMDGEAMRRRLEIKRQSNPGATVVGTIPEVQTVVSIHLDVDAGKSSKYLNRPAMLGILDAMPQPPTMVINSDGGDGGFHAYWLLDHPFRINSESDRLRICGIARRWQERLKQLADGKLDSTANIDRVLRVVGGMRSNGNRVTCEQIHPERLYSLDDLTIPPTDEELRAEVRREVRKAATEVLGPWVNPSGQPVSDYIDTSGITPEMLLDQFGYERLRDPDEWIRQGSHSGSRTLKIATSHDRPGINVFSGGDPNFACLKTDGSVGRYHSVDQMFVKLRHNGDWRAAARWCRERMNAERQRRQPVNLEGMLV